MMMCIICDAYTKVVVIIYAIYHDILYLIFIFLFLFFINLEILKIKEICYPYYTIKVNIRLEAFETTESSN